MKKETVKIDYLKLMEDYKSDNPHVREEAMVTMLNQLEKYIYSYIKEAFPTYFAPDKNNPNHENYEDIIQEANLAIIMHMSEYNPELGKPTTFFKPHIKSNVCKYINSMPGHGNTAHYAGALKKINTVRTKNNRENCTPEFLARETGISMETILKALGMEQSTQRISIVDNNDGFNSSNDDFLSFDTPEEAYLKKERSKIVGNSIASKLTEDEKRAVIIRYGFDNIDDKPESIKSTSIKISKTVEQTKRLLQSAVQKLKDCDDVQNLANQNCERDGLVDLLEEYTPSYINTETIDQTLGMLNVSLEAVEIKF